jgi:hypothetical protein
MDAQKEVFRILAECGAQKLASKKHNKWRLANGKMLTLAKSPKDPRRAWKNNLALLKELLGVSNRGKIERKGSPKTKSAKSPRQSLPLALAAPAETFSFRQKFRAALAGQDLRQKSEPSPPLPLPSIRRSVCRARHEADEHGPVHVWSKPDIEAANIALRSGTLNQFMQQRDRTIKLEPGAAASGLNQEITMLEPQQIDCSIEELKSGMEAAQRQVKAEEQTLERLQREMEESKQRTLAANNRYNSLNDVVASLTLVREDLVRVRPMLGLLADKSKDEIVRGRGYGGLGAAIKQILDEAQAPLTCAEVHRGLTSRGLGYKRTSIYGFFNSDGKPDGGGGIAVRLSDHRYWRRGRPLPGSQSEGEAAAPA